MKAQWVLLAALLFGGCATVPRIPPRLVQEEARGARTYSAELRVSISGGSVRGRATLIAAFERPDHLRLEMPGPSGARFIIVANGPRLSAVFPASRARFEGEATTKTVAEITGVMLGAPAIMDMLVGIRPGEATDYSAEWGEGLPRRVRCELADHTRLDVKVTRPEVGHGIPMLAFEPPPHEGYRAINATEAHELWLGR